MCGIAGVIRVYEPGDDPPPPLESIPEAWLDVLDDSIAHRGPDGEGRFRDRAVRDDGTVVDVALVHRRLSIIDHAGGAQPMVHDGERLRPDLVYTRGETPIVASEVEAEKPLVGVVFNGCIYNHRELRAELEGLGHVFWTDHSDTEVLVHGWRQWGLGDGHEDALQRRLVSMHAALIWDRTENFLTNLRDTFGEKPLYGAPLGARKPSTVVWSSCAARLPEFDSKRTLPMIAPGQHQGWIRHGWNESSSHKGVGSAHRWSAADYEDEGKPIPGGAGLAHWLDFAGSGEALTANHADALLRKAVHDRLEADVPVGVFLSGGIDSALVTKYASENDSEIRAYTVRMPSEAYDESDAAVETAEHLGVDLRVLDCDADPSSDLVELVEELGLPFGDSSMLPTAWVCRAASREVRVALSGDGGDELFCGYERHMVRPPTRAGAVLSRLIPEWVLSSRDPRSKHSKARRLIAARKCGRWMFAAELAAIFPLRDLRSLIHGAEPEPGDMLGVHKNRSFSCRAWDLDHYLRSDLLRKADTASMHSALEVRAPFLDPAVAEAAIRSPVKALVPNGERKGLLKQVARKYLSDYIVDRPKQGFAIPIGEWFRSDYGSMRQLLLDHLRSSDPFPGLAEAGVELNIAFVERMIREHDAAGEASINPWHGRDHSQRLYMLLVLSIWCKWLERVRQERPAAGAG